jgi:hypothetical protein
VDVIIYAVEKSLDGYKFNLRLINSFFLVTTDNNLGKRTIDGEAWMKNPKIELFFRNM